MRDLVIGIDGGTGGVRAYVFDAHGQVLGHGDAPYETQYPASGWAQQRPDDWWQAVCSGVRAAMEQAAVAPQRIAALCAATTSCTVLACAKSGEALDDAILWMDVRASKEAADIEALTGQTLSAELFVCKALWLLRNRPELCERADVLCEYQDYLNHRLTGEWCFSVNTACNWGYNKRKGDFERDFYRTVGLGAVLPKLPSRAVSAGERVGMLSPEAAQELGLDTDVMVVQGGIDSSIGMLGMGVAAPGPVALMTGSSNLAMAVTQEPMFGRGDEINLGPDFLVDGYYTSFRGQVSTGSILRWFKREFCRDLGDDAFRELDRLAAQVPPGSGGLTVLDYWQGNRVPHNDPDVRGLIYGLSMNTPREAVFRAVMEGVAYGTDDLLRAFTEKGFPLNAVCISGGTTRSDIFLQIHADVSGVPFLVTCDYSVALGCGICAARAAGMYDTLPQAAAAMVRTQKTVQPNAQNHTRYLALAERYRSLYRAIRGWVHGE
ncbi:FGGY-family carbohydrate kinase [Feifania hominis]|uniref:Carbohydrate kinase n=1 Tax=Feifania hominis TaxID=2763660 RepID=A0A926HQ99_9FIRM|nr:FGGY family carbohydrate kinase [Feifania hominis]MBC8536117.1 carbohydrate kinase [Feifania hominis]